MILTVTLNPSIDIAYQLPALHLDAVNRALETHKTPGGKGLNVTRVLKDSGDAVKSTGLLGGKTGEYLLDQLTLAGIPTAFYPIQDDTRNCIAILHEGKQTEILEAGPLVSAEEYRGFVKHFASLVKSSDAVVISGSPARGIPANCYARLTAIAKEANIPVILDCSGLPLKEALGPQGKPYAIKPNTDELRDLLGKEIPKDPRVLKEVLLDPLFDGICWIIVSLGKDGCFARHNHNFYHVQIPKISVVSPVGSGDSTVAGIASGIVHRMCDEDLLRHANTLGMLNAQEKETGRVNMNNYQELFRQITVTKV